MNRPKFCPRQHQCCHGEMTKSRILYKKPTDAICSINLSVWPIVTAMTNQVSTNVLNHKISAAVQINPYRPIYSNIHRYKKKSRSLGSAVKAVLQRRLHSAAAIRFCPYDQRPCCRNLVAWNWMDTAAAAAETLLGQLQAIVLPRCKTADLLIKNTTAFI